MESTLVEALTNVWPSKHSEELKRGITIRIGYADCNLNKCPKNHYSTQKKCPECNKETELVKKISFIDCPGHETLMATMMAGSAVMDGALLVVAANEPCPQPQTREHLMGLKIAEVENIIIVQNKIDVVSDEEALENHEEIKEFLKGTFAEDAPIIPTSALQKVNIDVLIKEMIKTFQIPEKDLESSPKMFVARSFDINKPSTQISKLNGGILGGSLSKGILKVGDEIEIKPGYSIKEGGEISWTPLKTEISSLVTGGASVKKVVPKGNIGVGTKLDPSLTKSDGLVGAVVGYPGKTPPTLNNLEIKVNLLNRVIGMKEKLKVEPLKKGEFLMINTGTATTVGQVTQPGKITKINLKRPICGEKGDKIAIARKVKGRWRLIGHSKIS